MMLYNGISPFSSFLIASYDVKQRVERCVGMSFAFFKTKSGFDSGLTLSAGWCVFGYDQLNN